MPDNFLVTTSLDETITEDLPEYLLLGKWCILYNKEGYWKKKNYKINPYHWDDRTKLKKDHDFLKLLYDLILKKLTDELNDFHKINKSKEYWTLIIGPWLSIYLPQMFDRWEILSDFFNNNNKCVTVKITDKIISIPNNLNDCNELYQTDEWNYFIFLDIIEKIYSEKVNFLEKFTKTQQKVQTKYFQKFDIKSKLISFFDNLIQKQTYNNKYFFYKSYFRFNKLLKINFLLKQLPRLYFNDFKFDYNKKNKRIINKNLGEFGIDNNFTNYIRKRIYNDIPFSYIENFSIIRNYTNSLKYKPEVIFTANGNIEDETFKIWVAEMVSKGKKLILSHHGGAFPLLFCNIYHEEECSYIYTTWFKEFNSNQKQLPPNKITSIKKITKGIFCSIIGYESTRFTFRAEASPLSHQCISCYEQVVSFCNLLDDDIFSYIKIRPFPNLGWNLEERYIQEFGINCIDSNKAYQSFISDSKIIICTYPQTTFSEAMSSGKPTILLYKKDLFELADVTNEIINELIKVKIIFTDSLEAAKHINNIWNDVNLWWQNKDVVDARNKFHNIALQLDDNWTNNWLNFFKNI